MCTDCANDDTCKDLVDESVQCADGYSVDYDAGDDDGIDDNRLCKLFKQASKERQYAKRKRELTIMPFVFLLLLIGGFYVSGTYTYFVRHKRAEASAAMLETDDDLNDSSKVNFAQLT
jgi:cbb3-type cytochrome oxidase subunit 3